MTEEIPTHDPPLTSEEEQRVKQLRETEIDEIDKLFFQMLGPTGRKLQWL